MPLSRFSVRNEYGLGQPELYREADKEDPKAVLDGVAVAGLVGILRQLGDLAEFAAEVFHGLQEQVMTTASRSHKLRVRVQHIEASLPPLEKAVLSQTSHIHFAYTAGSEWHPRIQLEQNHFVYNDLPRFIMDSYEECRDPPRFYMLDKFDAGGPGSCLKRYSDPTFFKRVSGSSIEATTEKNPRDKKARKSKKKRSSQRNGEISRVASLSNHSGRMNFTCPDVSGRTSSQTASTVDMTLKSDLGYHSNSFGSRTGSGYIECVFNLDSSSQPGEQESKVSTSRSMQHIDALDSGFCDEPTQMVYDDIPQSSSEQQIARSSYCVTWDEKEEIVEPEDQQCDRDEAPEVPSENFDIDAQDTGVFNYRNVDQMDILVADEDTPKSISDGNQLDEVESETDNYMDALNTIESESENDLDCQTKREVEQYSCTVGNGRDEDEIHELMAHSSDHYPFNIDSHTESNISSSNGMPSSLPNSDPSKSIVHEQTAQILEKSYDLDPHSSSNGMPFSLPNSVPSYSIIHEQAPQIPEESSDLDTHSSSNGMPFSLLNSVPTKNEQAPQIPEESSDLDTHSSSNGMPFSLLNSVPSKNEQAPQIPEESSDLDTHSSSDGMPFSLLNSVPSKSIFHEQTTQNPEKSSDLDPHSSSNGMPSSVPNSASTSISHEQLPQIPEKSSYLDDSLGIDYLASADILDGPKVESVISDGPKIEPVSSDPSFSGARISELQDQSGDNKIISSSCESQQSHAEFSGGHPVTFWTNGGLLGLEPSKPPDFAMSNATSQNVARTNYETGGPPNHNLKGDGHIEKLDTPVGCVDSDAKFENSSGSHNINRFNSSNVTALSESGAELVPVVEAKSTEANQGNDPNSSLVFGLGHRLLVNGFRGKLSLAHDDKSKPVSFLETGVSNRGSGCHHDAHQTISEITFVEQFGYGSPLNSLTSSPPLEHMKISFNPLDGSDTSKLKLKFPDGSHSHESVRDMFASFQLVPEPSIPLHDYGSESDDDTFCRSSPYMSDDCLSHHSDSNSEQWESGESTGGSKDQEMYDALCRMSSMESVSSSMQTEGMMKNGMHIDRGLQSVYTDSGAEPCLSGLDLPSFDTMNPLLQRESKTNPVNLLIQNPRDPNPLPPPLPPVQWRVSKPHSDVTEDIEYAVSEDPKHALDLKLLGSTISQQPELAPAWQQSTNREVIASKQESKQDQQKLNGHKEANRDANGKAMDEKDDFLHQIRSKSFNLRPTATARPNFTSGPPAKVTAILEKANAIRQAVGSDDGDDDDNWSDT
ncbi:hypothetical protein LWI29_036546 [Acer saccharum]|uniref:Protein SCAR n=1 Tax=Acer saccharum TaxID=4024 RepID=A0AA39RTP7_ACESA|nr:hypothetical protein LWI29_036546 [Acer saccharum]